MNLKPIEKGLFYACVTLLIWSSFHLVSRIGSTSNLTVFDLAALRIGISAMALSPWWLPRLIDKSKRKIPFYQVAALSLLTGIGYPLVAYTGYIYAPASHGAVIIVGLLPPFTSIFAYWLLKEKPNRLRVACIVCVLTGVASMLGSAIARTGLDLEIAKGDAIFALSSLMWALFTVLLHHWKQKAFDVTLGMVAVSAIVYLPIYTLFLPKALSQTGWDQIGLQALFQGVIVPVVATFTYAKAIENFGATRSVMLLSATPVVGTLLGVGVLGEPLYPLAAIGICIVFVGSIIGAASQKPQPSQ